MLPGMPVANLEVSRFLTCGVSVAIGVTESAYRILTACVVVSGLIGEIRVANAHRLGVCLRESPVFFSTRHREFLSHVALVRGQDRHVGS